MIFCEYLPHLLLSINILYAADDREFTKFPTKLQAIKKTVAKCFCKRKRERIISAKTMNV